MSKATVRPALGSARRLALILAAALLALAVSPAAQAGPILERTVAALRSDPVYQDSDAQYSLDLTAQTEVRAEIAAKTDHDVYVAMLPAGATSEDGDLDAFMRKLVSGVNPHGTFVILAGNQIRGASGRLGDARARHLAGEAYRARLSEGFGAVFVDFVDRVGRVEHPPPYPLRRAILIALGALALAGMGVLGVRRQLYLRRARRRFAEVRTVVGEDLSALGARLDDLDGVARARELHADATRRLEHATVPADLEGVTAAIEAGRYSVAEAEARAGGRTPPERRAPCFFDPRHGPSTRDVVWAPPGAPPRPVPACQADALIVDRGETPPSREVAAGGRTVPYWQAPPYFEPFVGGYFGRFGGGDLAPSRIFAGLLVDDA